MTKQEREIMRGKKNALALHTVQTALNNGFSMYDIEWLKKPINMQKEGEVDLP